MATLDPDEPLVAVFDLGMHLNELRWHLIQAVICGSEHHATAASTTLERIEICLAAMFPIKRGGQTREIVRQCLRSWDGSLDTEWFGELFSQVYRELNKGCIAREEAAAELETPVPDFADRIWKEVYRQLDQFPTMLAALQLGRCIDEGRHVQVPADALIVRRRRQKRQSSREARWTTEHEFVPRPIGAAEVAPAGNWQDEVQVLWQKAVASHRCPPITPADFSSPETRRQVVERLVSTARKALGETSAPGWNATSEPLRQPPDTGWHFEEDKFAFGGTFYQLRSKPLTLLRLVHDARRPPTSAELDRALWDDVIDLPQGDAGKRLRNLVSTLNRSLRDLFKASNVTPQIKGCGKGETRAWELTVEATSELSTTHDTSR